MKIIARGKGILRHKTGGEYKYFFYVHGYYGPLKQLKAW